MRLCYSTGEITYFTVLTDLSLQKKINDPSQRKDRKNKFPKEKMFTTYFEHTYTENIRELLL